MTDQGYEVLYDPPGDGNCQFCYVAFALRDLHIFRPAETLRNEIVSYLNTHDYFSDGIPLELFVGIPWSQYITEMARSGTYGDEITLRTICNMFNVEISVVSTLEQDGLMRMLFYVVLRRDEIASENESTMSLNKVELK